MAYRRGGLDGMAKAKMGATVTTSELDSGLQIGGILGDFHSDGEGRIEFARWRGPVQLAFRDQQLEGQGPGYHKEGYSTPLGTVQGKSLALWSDRDLETAGFKTGELGSLRFDRSGIELKGVWTGRIQREGRNVVLSFQSCTITRGEQTLYRPEWGPFDLACGEKVISVFGGAGDRTAWARGVRSNPPKAVKPKSNLTAENRELNQLYTRVREIREAPSSVLEQADVIYAELKRGFPSDWLLRLELLELCMIKTWMPSWLGELRQHLEEISKTRKDRAEMIARGLEILS
jgi:phenylalanine-4-hydroxylase